MRMRAMLTLAIIVLVTRAAGAQQVAYAANVMPELDSASQAALTREINAARDRGLPVEPLIGKVREGRLKRAPAALIRTAVAALARRLDSARAGLGVTATADELAAGAEALAQGADVGALRTIRSATTRPVAAPVGTLAQLLASGVQQRRALELVVSLLRRNASPSQILALGNLVEADVASGLGPEEAALFRLRGIEGSLTFGDKVTAAAAPGISTPPQPPASTSKPHRSP
jgi:hypothetical protein